MSEACARTDLPGGPVVLTERVPGVRSAALGVWVRAGSVHEQPHEMGVSHLLEHMVFKGTAMRSAREIALALERVGGSLDAYTTREHTSFQARVLDEHVDLALDVLADLVLAPLLREEDLELEREVVLEEIATVEDTPDDLVFDLHARLLWGQHPYGYSILGTRETVSALGSTHLRAAHTQRYGGSNLIVGAAGHVDHGHITDRVRALFAETGPRAAESTPQPDKAVARRQRLERGTAQAHIVFGVPTFPHGDARRFAMVLLSNALGGGMSSRLFQRVREELGLAYSVYSFQSFYRLSGMVGVYAGTRPESADRVEAVIREELERVARDGLAIEELDDAKGHVKGQIVLSLESMPARLHRVVAATLYDEPYRTVEDILRCVEAVTPADVAALAATHLDPDRHSVLRLGPAERMVADSERTGPA